MAIVTRSEGKLKTGRKIHPILRGRTGPRNDLLFWRKTSAGNKRRRKGPGCLTVAVVADSCEKKADLQAAAEGTPSYSSGDLSVATAKQRKQAKAQIPSRRRRLAYSLFSNIWKKVNLNQ